MPIGKDIAKVKMVKVGFDASIITKRKNVKKTIRQVKKVLKSSDKRAVVNVKEEDWN